ncbi:hypothetical protein DPMN_011241 [Dreissena polymorpha]|uniref:Uncharacterized protein n=1 Tax=Dreissena polymorpha TaxID=45954 RepID=A0A9D4N1C9_DREPO|nr:hypothetical protein DPMN_011241 [Dreissena polymorpha]
MQEKTNMVADNSARLGLNINRGEQQGVQDQRIKQHTHHSPRRGAGGGGQLHLSLQHSGQPGRNGCRCQNPHR